MFKKVIIGAVVVGAGVVGFKNPTKVKAGWKFVTEKAKGLKNLKLLKTKKG